jgi:sulfate adenylyltransferase subunit 1 (EFTu-like GTPase family)
MAVTIRLADEVDVSRGSMLAPVANPPKTAQSIRAQICWMTDEPLKARGRYLLQHTIHRARAIVMSIEHRIDIHALENKPADELRLNDLGEITLKCAEPIFYDEYRRNRRTGSFILIDEGTNSTVAAGMILGEA